MTWLRAGTGILLRAASKLPSYPRVRRSPSMMLIEIDHDTKGEPGMADIADTILRKIAESALFVADVTPLVRTKDGKALGNPNVLIEVGWALNKPGFGRSICVFNSAEGWTPEDLPFDIRHRRTMHYNLSEGADKRTTETVRKKLTKELTEAIRINLGEHIEEIIEATDITKVAAKAGDPSIWSSAKKILTHNSAFGGAATRTVALCEGSRSYMRIIPAGWKRGVPSVYDFQRLPESQVMAPFGGGNNGNYGACEEGFISYWFTHCLEAGTYVSENIACFFTETGEVWIIHGSAISKDQSVLTLNLSSMLRGWRRALRNTMVIFDKFGALQTRRVELGLVGMTGVGCTLDWGRSPQSRRDRFVMPRQSRDWNENAQLGFLTDAYNGVRDLFALPKTGEGELRTIFATD
jgi:hypothetical protein